MGLFGGKTCAPRCGGLGLGGLCLVVLAACASGQGGDGESGSGAIGSTGGTTDEPTSTEPIMMSGDVSSSSSTTDPSTTGDGSSTGTDETCDPQTWWPDEDGDGFGAMEGSVEDCEAPEGYVESSDDCDDKDDEKFPGQDETCDAQDNDCDGIRDEYSASNSACNGCDLFEYDGQSYAACPQEQTWADARLTCAALFNGDLWKIDDAMEADAVGTFLEMVDDGDWHMGLSDIVEEGEFIWFDGTLPTYENWKDMEPNNSDGEDCAEFDAADGGWNDIDCDREQQFVCEAPTP